MKAFKRLLNSDAQVKAFDVQAKLKQTTEPNVSFANISTQQENQHHNSSVINDRLPRIHLSQVEVARGQMPQKLEVSSNIFGAGSQLFLNPIFKTQYSVRPLSLQAQQEHGYYQPIKLDAFVDDCRLTMREAEDEPSLHDCFEDGPSPINGLQKQQYFDIQRDDSPLSAHDKPLNNAYVVIGDSYHRVMDMIAQEESVSQRLPSGHSENDSG